MTDDTYLGYLATVNDLTETLRRQGFKVDTLTELTTGTAGEVARGIAIKEERGKIRKALFSIKEIGAEFRFYIQINS